MKCRNLMERYIERNGKIKNTCSGMKFVLQRNEQRLYKRLQKLHVCTWTTLVQGVGKEALLCILILI